MPEGIEDAVRKSSFSFRFETFCVFESCLEEMLSSSAASVILQAASNKCGRHSCKDIMREIKAKENVLAYLSNLKNEMNWGRIRFVDIGFQNGRGSIVVHDSFEVAGRKSTKPCCHFLRGYFAGFLSELFGREITVEEEQCASTGASCCKFSFRQKES